MGTCRLSTFCCSSLSARPICLAEQWRRVWILSPIHSRRPFPDGEFSVNTYVRGVVFIWSSLVMMPDASRSIRACNNGLYSVSCHAARNTASRSLNAIVLCFNTARSAFSSSKATPLEVPPLRQAVTSELIRAHSSSTFRLTT